MSWKQDFLHHQSNLALRPFIHHGRLHLRFLQFWIKRHWAQHRQSWDPQIQLDAEFFSQLRWFNRQEVLQGVPLHLPEPTLFFFTDASLTGWGANWPNSHLSGQWSPQDSSQHINWLELEAIHLAALQWGPQWHNQTVRMYCDNSTAVAYIYRQGGTHSISLFNKTLELFQSQSDRMEDSSRNLTQSVLCLRDPPSGHVRHDEEPGDSSLRFTLTGWQSLGGRHALHILGWLRPSLCLPSSSHPSQNSPENQGLPWHHGDSNCFPAPVSTVAPTATKTQPASFRWTT